MRVFFYVVVAAAARAPGAPVYGHVHSRLQDAARHGVVRQSSWSGHPRECTALLCGVESSRWRDKGERTRCESRGWFVRPARRRDRKDNAECGMERCSVRSARAIVPRGFPAAASGSVGAVSSVELKR